MPASKIFYTLRRGLPRLFSALILIAVFLAALPASAQAAAPAAPCQGADCAAIKYNPNSRFCIAYHTVKNGESLRHIANRYGVPIRILMMVNGLTRNYQLDVGETLCIPPEGVYTFYKWDCYYSDPIFEAYASGKRVYLEGSDFPRSNTYFVRVAPYGSGAWKRMGSVTASRHGLFSASFKIPSNMRKYPVLMVCIKNVDNDRVYCTAVFND